MFIPEYSKNTSVEVQSTSKSLVCMTTKCFETNLVPRIDSYTQKQNVKQHTARKMKLQTNESM